MMLSVSSLPRGILLLLLLAIAVAAIAALEVEAILPLCL